MMVKASEIAFRRTIKRYLTQQYGNIRIEALHAPAVTSGVVGRIVGVATLGDRLALTITSTSLIDVERAESDRDATAFLSAGVKHLELAVRQEVAFKAARSCLSIDDRKSRTPFAHTVRL
ncbi:MAG: hypothetical protein N4J56_004544 [Chroococcidiopsis sp. SAG 2025]|uniref:hypothetical protein n=1 Tax=Chroococcidiopsis sp. SAG 2025 TaxID=171389 RepID=UPI002936FB19|nr:hypothetical protein [Chroococcidiopsis sp. SAG 2025]MDV2994890.1 hypothetical protein [Chroococcidiopsis sp. SAG 2025]